MDTLKKLVRIPLACFGVAIIVTLVIAAVFAPHLAPRDPYLQDVAHVLEPPSKQFPLGTDRLGRDVLSRLVFGSRVALIVSVGAIGLGVLVGLPLGVSCGYLRGWFDEVMMRIMDGLLAFPSLIIALALVAVLGGGLLNVIIAIGVANVPFIARVVRSAALSVREQEYITAARAMGARTGRIIFRHVMPNCMAPVIVQSTIGMAYAILTEASLGFLGMGVPPPTPTWGNMLQFAFPLVRQYPLLSVSPGVAIFITVLAFNLVGDALRDILDPRLKGLFR